MPSSRVFTDIIRDLLALSDVNVAPLLLSRRSPQAIPRRRTKVSPDDNDDEFFEDDDHNRLNLADANEDLEPEEAAALAVMMQSRTKIFDKKRQGCGRGRGRVSHFQVEDVLRIVLLQRRASLLHRHVLQRLLNHEPPARSTLTTESTAS